jgi:hypothetical protein
MGTRATGDAFLVPEVSGGVCGVDPARGDRDPLRAGDDPVEPASDRSGRPGPEGDPEIRPGRFRRETTKTNTTFLQTFHLPNRGLAGIVLFGRARFYSPPALKRSMRASLSVSFQLPSVFRMAADILCGIAQTICHAGATERA